MRDFQEYVNDGIAKRQSPDLPRSRALHAEAEASRKVLLTVLKAVPLSDETANHAIKNAYDILMEFIRAKMLAQGYNTIGKGAHEAEVAYLREIGFSISDVEFADRLRYFRNGIVYYGKSFDAVYAKKVLAFLERIRKRLG